MRTDAEVTAAAERTADITLRLVAALRDHERARAIAVALSYEVDALLDENRRLRTRVGNQDTALRQLRQMRAVGDVVGVPLVRFPGGTP